MVGTRNTLIITLFILCSAFIPLTEQTQVAQAQDEGDTGTGDTSQTTIDSEALEVLKEMSDALISLKEFTFDSEITNDNILASGQTIQIGATMKTSVKRPNHVYVKYIGDSGTREVWYNGNQITIYSKNKNYYGQLETPDTIDKTMDFLMTNYNFSLALADILNSDPYDSFMETTEEGIVVGDSRVRGEECTHLAFIGKYVDWQIWISNDDPALLYKFVINYKELEGAPQYQAIFSNWNTSPDLSDSVFKANLPKDAVKIDFINFKKQKGDAK
ncbi:MAG: DUF2092 domain-containing protein [Deltaproteobacteria bacterium]|nr:DUF2092 domain-containing protein [Deltaproteobacteria bacterium]